MTIYIDDSGTSPENAVAVAAGWIAHTDSWVDFQADWDKARDIDGDKFDSMHMAEFVFGRRGTEFEGWSLEKKQRISARLRGIIKNTAAKPLDIQRWLKSLHEDNGLAWTTITKMRGVMHRIYRIGILHEHVAKNPLGNVETRSKTDYNPIVITPVQTLAILKALSSPLHFTLVLTCAATALRASEMLALRWADVLWNEGRIRISKRSANGKDGETKTEASDGYVPFRCIRFCPRTCARGENKAPTRKTETLCSRL
jgi:integrase